MLKTVQSMQAVAHLTEHFERGMRRGSIVPGTRFRLGAINTADQIRSLYDWPEYQARLTSMRPNKSSTAGFLGPKEDLVEVLLSDHLEMQKLGVTNVQLGQWLQRLLTRGRMTLHHQRLDCGAQFSTMGSQTPPLPGPLERGQSEFNPFNRDSGFRILGNVTELHPGLIELWGFCEGRQCSYTEPQQLELLNELEALTKHKVPQWMRDKYSKPQTYRIEPADLVRLFFGESR